MCLSNGREFTENKKPKHGWKVFNKDVNDAYCFHIRGYKGSRRVPCNRWITAEKTSVYYGQGSLQYDTGFHVYKTRGMAQQYVGDYGGGIDLVVVKVKVRDVQIVGTQYNHIVYVADKMLVPRKKRK